MPMTPTEHENRPPDIPGLLKALNTSGVRYILLDHLFCTCFGNLDVVPDLTGDYEILVKRAVKMDAHGQEVWVVHVDELLTALTIPRRKKDVPRVRQLREVQRRLNRPQPRSPGFYTSIL